LQGALENWAARREALAALENQLREMGGKDREYIQFLKETIEKIEEKIKTAESNIQQAQQYTVQVEGMRVLFLFLFFF